MTESPIIPTPAYAKYGADIRLTGADRQLQVALRPDPGAKERIALQTLRAAVTALGGNVTAVSEPGAASVVLALPSADGAEGAAAGLDAEDLATFEQPNGAEQGYVIRPAADASRPLRLVARDPQGLLYAAVTLAQLLRLEDGRIVARAPHIRDWPSFRYRGNNWLLWVECGRWSYERGDGAAAYAERIERKLDFSLQHKINLLIFDGFGWNPERFPGYGALARRCARYARERGIKLLVGGYGAGYGAGHRYDGHIFRNRHGYPDGELYDCYRFVGRDRSSTFGTCLSNAELTALKQEELSRFVRAAEPGALYLHFLDIEDMAGHELSWSTRCPACRERWPNDALAAADGAAGGFAQLYDALCDAVFSVSNPETGYDASRDCIPILISPAYTVRTDSDAIWQSALRYWAAVSRSMRNVDNVQFGLREQFLSEDGATYRLQELRRVLDAEGRGHATCAVVFAGADGNENDHLYSANPVLSKYYLGVDTVLNASGHAYQEPLQMLNAEYGWRATDNPWFDEQVAATRDAAIKRYDEYLYGLRRPAGIFGPEGFLEAACRRLYGPEAGARMASVSRLVTEDGEPPVAYLFHTAFLHTDAQWARDHPSERARRWSTRWRRIAAVTETAAAETRLATALVAETEPARGDLAWMADTLLAGRDAAEIMTRYFAMYAVAQDRAAGDTTIELAALERQATEIRRRIDLLEAYLQRNFSPATLDPQGGDLGHWPDFVAALRKRTEEVVRGSRSGRRGELEPHSWW